MGHVVFCLCFVLFHCHAFQLSQIKCQRWLLLGRVSSTEGAGQHTGEQYVARRDWLGNIPGDHLGNGTTSHVFCCRNQRQSMSLWNQWQTLQCHLRWNQRQMSQCHNHRTRILLLKMLIFRLLSTNIIGGEIKR